MNLMISQLKSLILKIGETKENLRIMMILEKLRLIRRWKLTRLKKKLCRSLQIQLIKKEDSQE